MTKKECEKACECCVVKKPRQKRNKRAKKKSNYMDSVTSNAVPLQSIPQYFQKDNNQGLSEILTNILKQQKQNHIITQTKATKDMATEVAEFDSLDEFTPLSQSSMFIPIPKPQENIHKPKSPKKEIKSNNDFQSPSSNKYFASPQIYFKNTTPPISAPAPPPSQYSLFDDAHQIEIVPAEQPPMKGYKPAQPAQPKITPKFYEAGSLYDETQTVQGKALPQVVMPPFTFGNNTPAKPIRLTDENFQKKKIVARPQKTINSVPIKTKATGNTMLNYFNFPDEDMGILGEGNATRLDKFRKEYDSSNRFGVPRGPYNTTLNFLPENIETTRGMVERGPFTHSNTNPDGFF